MYDFKKMDLNKYKNVVVSAADTVSKKVSGFEFFDLAVYKATVFTFGVLIGAAFSKLIKKLAWLIALVAGAGVIYLIARVLNDNE